MVNAASAGKLTIMKGIADKPYVLISTSVFTRLNLLPQSPFLIQTHCYHQEGKVIIDSASFHHACQRRELWPIPALVSSSTELSKQVGRYSDLSYCTHRVENLVRRGGSYPRQAVCTLGSDMLYKADI
jgi:hypothetical protein